MSDEQRDAKQREYDAAVIAKYRASLDLDFTWDGWTNPERLALDTRDAALREIDRLTAERNAARAELAKLRAAVDGDCEGNRQGGER